MKKCLWLLLLLPFPLMSACPLFSVGGGYWMAGKNHSSGLLQFEYIASPRWFGLIRPQASVIIPEFKAFFVGVGIGIDLYLSKHIVLSPNFEPGLYSRGKGKNLGYPLEFRSAFEIAYECNSKARLGAQFWHISNASLGCHNPGANGATLFFATPLKFCY